MEAKKIKKLFEEIFSQCEKLNDEQMDELFDLHKLFKKNKSLSPEQYQRLIAYWEFSKLGKAKQRKIPVKKLDIDRIQLRKFQGEKTYYFASYNNVTLQISKETFEKIQLYQLRNIQNPDDAKYILTLIENDRNKFKPISKN